MLSYPVMEATTTTKGRGADQMNIQGIAEIVLNVHDKQVALAFYRDLLGLEVISPPELPNVFLKIGSGQAGIPQMIVLVPISRWKLSQRSSTQLRTICGLTGMRRVTVGIRLCRRARCILTTPTATRLRSSAAPSDFASTFLDECGYTSRTPMMEGRDDRHGDGKASSVDRAVDASIHSGMSSHPGGYDALADHGRTRRRRRALGWWCLAH
jgi:hypothetical protein